MPGPNDVGGGALDQGVRRAARRGAMKRLVARGGVVGHQDPGTAAAVASKTRVDRVDAPATVWPSGTVTTATYVSNELTP